MDATHQVSCIVCGQEKPAEEGLFIVSQFVCLSCEAEMVETDVKDVKYPFFIHQLRKLWYRRNA
ncbi:MAG: Inhibitor of sigma-G Gin [Paenibacillaceae bacterium]|jgi:hypothetical protein|nr:Inhibitor of sigma-G Gin [Paenibacillaceae bacterium]